MGKIIWFIQRGIIMGDFSVFDVADIFLSLESMTHKKLQKLCYYAQAWHLALLDKPLFNEPIEAWIHGPVVPQLYQEYKQYGWEEIPRKVCASEKIKGNSLELLKEVYKVYGQLDGDELEILSHEEEPWIKARQDLDELEPSHEIISHDIMRNYYLKIYEKQQQND